MRRWRLWVVLVALVAGVAWWQALPRPLPASTLDGITGDASRGALVFAAAGCAACHMAPGADLTDAPVLSGGRAFPTAFGTFIAPNISTDPVAGIGDWSDMQILNAVMRGIGRDGQHLYPAFPYATYGHAALQDMADLISYLRTLPADSTPSKASKLAFPFSFRPALGLWKRLFIAPGWVVSGDLTPEQARGRYLVEALGHCAECHTPRNILGGPERDHWLAGAKNPAGRGRIPNITPARLDWSKADIAEYLKSGFTPSYDTVGGAMAEVVANTAHLTDADRAAIAAYLKIVPPVAR
ncbi:MAG: c-type cytochrome [Limimaricola sp.]|uniref:cytochrome c n=1 Tax=Limimaricola sp. TaxID=2211665 RepID=UPI001DDBD571|nr:cytochrome c [Limimaricola sp.]MBI1418126.1 c-type cytochrome [Limimaricola sp.]